MHPAYSRKNSSYFGQVLYKSPQHSSPSNDSDDSGSSDTNSEDGHSDSTLEDYEMFPAFGHPLQRLPRMDTFARNNRPQMRDSQSNSSSCPSRSESSSSMTSSLLYDAINYEDVVDSSLSILPKLFPCCEPRNLIMCNPPPTVTMKPLTNLPLMIKRLPNPSPELSLLLKLNQVELRQDPWNPSPHILRIVGRNEYAYLCMERLMEYNQPPLKTVAQYIDFFRQTLEGLSFLHEHHIANLACSDPSSYMVDLSSAVTSAHSAPHPASQKSAATFDRFTFPVRYYFVNYSKAIRVPDTAQFPKSMPPTPFSSRKSLSMPSSLPALSPYRRDVEQCGLFFDRLLSQVPQIAPKFQSLIKAMTVGGFTADDARRLFEALCRSLESRIFDMPILFHPD